MKLYIIALTIAIAGCNANERKSEESVKISVPLSSVASVSNGCYRMIVDKDTATMNLKLQADSVNGTLVYNRFEKDSNHGTFQGKVDSNKVIAWYKFRSEGMITVRQVIFKIVGNKLEEAYGDVDVTSDTAYFKYPHTLNYEETHAFEKIGCP